MTWTCKNCGVTVLEGYNFCAACIGLPPEEGARENFTPEPTRSIDAPEMKYKHFHSTWSSWDNLFSQAAEFATRIGRDRVVNISQSDSGKGVVTVWYWSK